MQNGSYYSERPTQGQCANGLPVADRAVEDELGQLLREYRDAKGRFDNACLNAQSAQNERMAASDALSKLSDVLQKAIDIGRFDKTQPMSTEPQKQQYQR